MSLQQIMNEQMAIRQQLQLLSERLMANDQRIQQLSGGGGGAAVGAPARTFAPPPRGAANGRPAAPATYAAAPTLPQGGRGALPTFSAAPPGAKKTLAGQKLAIEKMHEEVPDMNAFEEPKDAKKGPAAIDRCEELLRKAFFHFQEAKPTRASNPIAAMQTLLRQLDTNHSGKIDSTEFKTLCSILGFSSNEAVLDGLFARYDLDKTGLVDQEEFGRMLLKPAGDVESQAKSALARMREVLAYRAGGFPHLKSLYTQFKTADHDKNQKLSKEEFDVAMDIFFSYYKVKFSPADKSSLFQFFDRDGGGINYDEYIRAVRGDMNEFRENWVREAFSILDRDGSGVITDEEMAAAYDTSQNPDVKRGKVSPAQALKHFMAQFGDKNTDGKLTIDEFIENYNWISASIDSDDYWELMIRNAWHISGGSGWCENTANRRVLVEHSDGSAEVVEIKHDLGLDATDTAEVIRRLTQQGVKDIKKVKLYG